MNIEKGLIIELEDGIEYLVLDKIQDNGKEYIYTATMTEPPELKFFELKSDRAFLVTDDKQLKKLLAIAAKNAIRENTQSKS